MNRELIGMILFIIILAGTIGFVRYKFLDIQNQRLDIKIKIADFELNYDLLILEGCKISCAENNLTYTNTNKETKSCSCAESNGELRYFKSSMDKISEDKFNEIMNQNLIWDLYKDGEKKK